MTLDDAKKMAGVLNEVMISRGRLGRIRARLNEEFEDFTWGINDEWELIVARLPNKWCHIGKFSYELAGRAD